MIEIGRYFKLSEISGFLKIGVLTVFSSLETQSIQAQALIQNQFQMRFPSINAVAGTSQGLVDLLGLNTFGTNFSCYWTETEELSRSSKYEARTYFLEKKWPRFEKMK